MTADLERLLRDVGPVDADAAQERFVRRADNLRGWLLKIAHNKAIDAHRARQRAPVPAEEVDPGATDARPDPPDDALWSAVHALPERQRTAVILRFTFDLAYREMGQVMDSSEEAARRNVFEGLKKLREEY